MGMKIICTICSRNKDEAPGLVPAVKRYTGKHIPFAEALAKKSGPPLFFLSGKYGLISGQENIPYYDYRLEEDRLGELVKIIVGQIRKNKISEIEFYYEDKPSWVIYRRAIESAAEEAGIILLNNKFLEPALNSSTLNKS